MSRYFLRNMIRRLRAPFDRRWAFQRLTEYHREPRTLPEVVEWAMNFGGRGFYRIKTLQKYDEILNLAQEVARIKPRIILEIGTARGGTLLIWSAIASEQVISCDIQDLSKQKKLFESLTPPGSECKITLLTGDTHNPSFKKTLVNILNGRKVDFLFIDGDHTIAGVTQDFQDYRDFVRPGGLIAFHDIVKKTTPFYEPGLLFMEGYKRSI